jgi:hypothetical protein
VYCQVAVGNPATWVHWSETGQILHEGLEWIEGDGVGYIVDSDVEFDDFYCFVALASVRHNPLKLPATMHSHSQ